MTQCRQCGTTLPEPLPKFCPQCGAPAAPASPFPPSQPAVNPGAAWATHKHALIATGLFVLGLFMGGVPAFGLLGLAWVVAIPLIVLDAINLPFMAQLPAFLRRPALGAAVALLALVTTVVPAGLMPGWFLVAGGTYMWIKDANRRGELAVGPFDLRLAWYGWRRWLLIGMTLAAFTFSGAWEPWTYVSGYGYTERSGSWDYHYWVPGKSFGEHDASYVGAMTLPAIIMTVVLLWAAYTGKDRPVPSWFRYLPLASAAIMVLNAFRYMGVDAWTKTTSGVLSSPGWGPYGFILFLVPFIVAAVNLARGKNHWKAGM